MQLAVSKLKCQPQVEQEAIHPTPADDRELVCWLLDKVVFGVGDMDTTTKGAFSALPEIFWRVPQV
jgi:hypothetical protein